MDKETIYKFVEGFYSEKLCLLRSDDSEKRNVRDAVCTSIDDVRCLDES